MIEAGKRISQAGLVALIGILCLFFLSLRAGTTDKRLEVTTERASIRLDPKESSPLVANLVRGSVLTLATEVKFCREWLYVRFKSPTSGTIRSGYVREQDVRRLVPKVRMIHIAAEGEVMNPKDLDFNPSYLPSVEWGTAREKIIKAEGRPYKSEPIKSGEIQLVVNTPAGKSSEFDDSYIRKAAIRYKVPYITTTTAAKAAAGGIAARRAARGRVRSLQDYHATIGSQG